MFRFVEAGCALKPDCAVFIRFVEFVVPASPGPGPQNGVAFLVRRSFGVAEQRRVRRAATTVIERGPLFGLAGETARRIALTREAEDRTLSKVPQDLRAPVQALVLIHGLLAKTVVGDRERSLVARFDEALKLLSARSAGLIDASGTDGGTLQVEWLGDASRGRRRPASRAAAPVSTPVVFVVDDDSAVRGAIRSILEDNDLAVEDFADPEAFFATYTAGRQACLLVDAHKPGMQGLELLQRLSDAGDRLPVIMITANGDVPTAVQAMKAGASDFIEKPIARNQLLNCVGLALETARDLDSLSARRDAAVRHVAGLTTRERQIMDLVLAGDPSKNIAADLGISRRTVENHRASIMHKTGSKSLPALARLALTAVGGRDSEGIGPRALLRSGAERAGGEGERRGGRQSQVV